MSAPADTEKPAHFAMDWLQAYGDRLYSYAVARVSGDQAVAEDLVQETLLAAIKAYPRFKGESTLETWLIGILRRKVIDRYRKASRRLEADGAEHGESSDGLFDSRGSLVDVIKWKGATSEQVQSAEFREVFDSCLAELNPPLAEAFTLCVMDQLSTEEACSILGITSTNLSVRLHRARVRLRKLLQSRWFEVS